MMKKTWVVVLLVSGLGLDLGAWENLPEEPYGQANLLPQPGELVVSPFYSYTRWIHFYDNEGHKKAIPERQPEEDFEVNDGMFNFEYGLKEALALDLTVGYGTAATRFFDPLNRPHTSWGSMDTQIGLRYRFEDERRANSKWMPTLTVRLGGIILGNYDEDFPFAQGSGGSGGEVGLFANKTIICSGLNLYSDATWRIRTHGVPQKVATRIGLYYDIEAPFWVFRMFTPNVAYKFLNSFGGSPVIGNGPDIQYSHTVREMSHLLEGGMGVTDKGGRRYQFYFDWGFMGENTPAVMTYGLYASFPFAGK